MILVENVENGSSEERVAGQESPAEECATKRSKYSEVTHWIIKKWIFLLGLALLALTLYGLKIIADFIGFAFGPGHLGAETPLRWPNGSVVVNVRQYPTWNNNGTPIPLDNLSLSKIRFFLDPDFRSGSSLRSGFRIQVICSSKANH